MTLSGKSGPFYGLKFLLNLRRFMTPRKPSKATSRGEVGKVNNNIALMTCYVLTSHHLRCWLNADAYDTLIWNTSGVSKSSSDWLDYTGFLGDACVAFFNVPPLNKDAVTLSRKKNAVVFTNVTRTLIRVN